MATATRATSDARSIYQHELVTRSGARMALAAGRIVIGWTFLWAFLDKTFGLGFTTPAEEAWLRGGTPAQGYLDFAVYGPFTDFFQLFSNSFGDWLFMLGLLGIGVAMVLGAGLKIAAITGTLLMLFMYLAGLPFLGEAPLVGTDQRSVAVLARGRLADVAVPAKALALAARGDGTVTAAAPAGWWHLRPGVPARGPTPWESAQGRLSPTIVSYWSGSVLTVVPAPRPRLLVYADRPQDVRLAFTAPLTSLPAQVTWRAAPGGTWGILDRVLVDLRAGRVSDLGAWTTQHITLDRALGRIGDQSVVAGPAVPRGVLRDGEGFPEDVTAAGALVRAEEDGDQYLYLLPPATGPAAATTR